MTIEPLVFKTSTKEIVFKTTSKQVIASDAGNIYWTGHRSGNFSSKENWSLVPGGPPSSVLPGPTDNVVFDSNAAGDCLFDIPVEINKLSLLEGYGGIVKQKGYPFVSGDVLISGGTTLILGSSYVKINGTLTVA